MSKRILLVLFAAAALTIVATLVWLVQRPTPPVSAATVAGPAHPHSDDTRSKESDEAPAAELRRTETFVEEKTASPGTTASLASDAPSFEVQVVSKKNGEPVAGAEVSFASRDDEVEADQAFWTWQRECVLEEKLEPLATHFVADAEGKARVPMPGKSAIVVAKSGELWGYATLGKKSEAPLKIELVADAQVAVKVVDPRGAPVANARVVMRSRQGQWFTDRLATTTAADGTATLRHVGHGMSLQQAGFRMRWFVGLAAALEQPVEVELDAAKLPAESVELVMPATGECEVRVLDPAGAPHAELVEVSLRILPRDASLTEMGERNHERDAVLPNCRGGNALFRHVELGRSIEARVQRAGSNVLHRTRALGPTAAGQRAVITVRLGELAPVLAGRVLDESGAVLANAKLRSRIENAEDHNYEYSWQVASDAEGRFQLDINESEGESVERTLTLYTVDERDQEFAAARRALPGQLGPGVHELGDLVLQSSPLLASGIVVDEQGQPIKGAAITPAIKRSWDDSDPNAFWWEELYASRGTSDEQGRFEIHARLAVAEIGLWASKKEAKGDVVLIAPGASGVTLRMLATGEIAGRVLLDPSVPRDALGVAVERLDDGDAEPNNQWTPPAALDEEGKFSLKGLRPANYLVRLNNLSTWGSVQEVAEVRVEGGAVTRDPRLDPLDLRASLRAFQLDIVDADDHPIAQGMILAHPPGNSEAELIHAYFQNGRAVLFHSGLGLDLTISCEGFRDTFLHAVSASQRVVMRRGVDLRFRLARNLSAPQPPVYLGVVLEPVEGGESARNWFGEESYFDARGELALKSSVVGRATLMLTITLRDEQTWTTTYYADETERVIDIADRAGEQVFEVAFDAAKLEEQIKSLRDSADQ